MKLRLSLKDKEASLEADVEKLVEKGMDHKAQRPAKKPRYQIKAEEKRKTAELQHKQSLQWMFILLGLIGFLLIFGIIATLLNI